MTTPYPFSKYIQGRKFPYSIFHLPFLRYRVIEIPMPLK